MKPEVSGVLEWDSEMPATSLVRSSSVTTSILVELTVGGIFSVVATVGISVTQYHRFNGSCEA